MNWMMASGNPLLQELCCKMKLQGLRPRTLVDYIREPFVYGPGNVRVTLDHQLRTGLRCVDFLNPCLLYTSPSPRDVEESRMPSSA